MSTPSIPELYNKRASEYDDKTTFHRRIAAEYVKYANPEPGESLLDLACGTGLVAFLFAQILQSPYLSNSPKPKIVGVDISPGMLDVAREKLEEKECVEKGLEISFIEHDITTLGEIEELKGTEGMWDIITICSALVLLHDPASAVQHWASYLKKGGRLVVDVPHPRSMLALKVLGDIADEFGVKVLGNRKWIQKPESLRGLMEDAGLDAEVTETEIWDDIPARTDAGKGVWGTEDGGIVFDEAVKGSGFEGLGEEQKGGAREAFVREWGGLKGDDGLVREEGRLFVGVGVKW